MSESNRLAGCTEWIDLEFVERERTPRQAIEVGIQLHLSGPSLSNTKQRLEKLGVERSHTAIHNWVQKADLQPTSDGDPNQIALDEPIIRINDDRHWLYAAVDPTTNKFLHIILFQTRTTQLTYCFSANSATNTRSSNPSLSVTTHAKINATYFVTPLNIHFGLKGR
jgi:transposase-like protein